MSLRKYGDKDYKVVVVYGGPGAAGSVKPICEELSNYCGVIEPLHAEKSVEGQLWELEQIDFICLKSVDIVLGLRRMQEIIED